MATSNKVFVSPGVYTSERDLSFVAQSVGVTTLGIVGETLKGPAFEPIFVSSFDEFSAIFGGTSPEKFVDTQIPKYEAAYIAKSYLSQSNQLFVSRILGLSGYDAGPSWSISTIANVSGSSVSQSGIESSVTVTFTGTTGGTSTVSFGSLTSTIFNPDLYSQFTLSDGTTSTIIDKLKSFVSGVIGSNASAASTSATTAYVFGTMPDNHYNLLTGAGYTVLTNVYGVPNLKSGLTDYSSRDNDSWYYAQFNPTAGNGYSGYSFESRINTMTGSTGSFSGSVQFSAFTQIGTAFTNYNDVVVATLRSRGESTYSTGTNPIYQVTGTTNVKLDFGGTYSGASMSPYSPFGVSGVTNDGSTFEFKVSLDSTDSNYISKVFGLSNFGKPANEVPLFVEEQFNNFLNYSYKKGYIRGINSTITALPSAQDDNGSLQSIGCYLEQYQTPETPFVVSELRGNNVYKLFKFILISDGNDANQEVKISILNISFNNGTFDVGIRAYNDTDANPVYLEKFTNCSMNPGSNSFVGVKIGTSDGEYAVRSKYVMLEISSEAPTDALPCGFEGYSMRNYYGSVTPFPIYKTKYDVAGEVIFQPPMSSVQRSSGDKINRVFLGLSDTVGYDPEYYDYKGILTPSNLSIETSPGYWDFLSKGFHMDSGATVVTISNSYSTSGTSAFEVGNASFGPTDPTDPTNPYYRIQSRKFTLFANGGFDGWDIYRKYRTNGDNYVLGGSGYLKGAAPTTQFPSATGWGAFKQITVEGNTTEWANTDYYAYLLGQQTFGNPEATNINVFVTPGIDFVNNSNLVEDAIDMIESQRADSLYIMTCPDYNMFVDTTTSVATDLIYPTEAVDNLDTVGIDSNYTATYYPWVLTRDTVNNTQIYLPPTAEVCRNLALTDNISFPWFASAGYTRGIVNSVKARKKLTQDDRDTLYQGRINPIATFSDVGTLIWGNKTTQVAESALDRINVRRLLLQARKLISAVAVRLLFEQNDDKVRQDFLDAVNPILDSIRRDRGLIDFRVVVTNTPEDLDRNTMTGKIYLKPTKALEFIDIEFLITPTGASFENI
jgi:hypothetical protein